MPIALSKVKRPSEGQEVSAARTTQKVETIDDYYEKLVYHPFLFQKSTEKVLEDGILKVYLLQF